MALVSVSIVVDKEDLEAAVEALQAIAEQVTRDNMASVIVRHFSGPCPCGHPGHDETRCPRCGMY